MFNSNKFKPVETNDLPKGMAACFGITAHGDEVFFIHAIRGDRYITEAAKLTDAIFAAHNFASSRCWVR